MGKPAGADEVITPRVIAVGVITPGKLRARGADCRRVIRDAGYISFIPGEEGPTVVHGPHPFLEGEQDVVCSYLV